MAFSFWKSASSSISTSVAPVSAAPPPPAPAYALSEQRRRELLLAARASRVSWIDGSAAPTAGQAAAGDWARGGSSVPPQCQQALEAAAADLQALVGSLDELKRLIIPNNHALLAPGSSSTRQGDEETTETHYRSVFQDLFERDAALSEWLRVRGREAASPARRARLTADDREMVFLLAFRELVALLKNPRAAELVYQVQSFVQRFETAWDLPRMLRQRAPAERPGGQVQAFVAKLVQQLRHNDKLLEYMELSDNNEETTSEFLGGSDEWSEDLLHEVLEAFIMEKVYVKALTPAPPAEQEDRLLRARLQSLAFVDFHHLDLPPPDSEEREQAWQRLVTQLQQMPLYMAPRRKMDCVLRVCQDLTKLLASQKADGRFPSADEFLPGLIYLLLKANPSELKRNVNYILEYRNPSKLVSEPGYFFTHLVSSVAFLEQVDGSLLTISPEEFEEGLRRSKQQVLADVTGTSPAPVEKEGKRRNDAIAALLDEDPPLPSVLEVRARRLAMMASLE